MSNQGVSIKLGDGMSSITLDGMEVRRCVEAFVHIEPDKVYVTLVLTPERIEIEGVADVTIEEKPDPRLWYTREAAE